MYVCVRTPEGGQEDHLEFGRRYISDCFSHPVLVAAFVFFSV